VSNAEKSADEYKRQFREKQAASRREIQRKLRLIREAKRNGEKPPDLGPFYD
jgi:hypothetical protein